METRAGYVLVGAFVLVLFLGGLGLAVWFGDLRLDRQATDYRIEFDGSVGGLSVGSPVRYRGVPVGSVTGIQIAPANVEKIQVDLEVDATLPIKADMYATLESQGLTGVGFIQIQGGSQAAPLLPAAVDGQPPTIPSRASRLEKVFESAPEIASQLVVLTARLQGFFSQENQDSVTEILRNLAVLSASLGRRTGDIEAAVVDGAAAASEVRSAMAELVPLIRDIRGSFATITDEIAVTLSAARGTVSGIDVEIGRLSERLSATTEKIGGTATQLEALVAEARPGMRDFSNSGLYELTQFLIEARVLVGSLDRVVRQIDRDPKQFLFGRREGQVETQQ
ncbi:MAG: MlaD family protein [Thalassobaculum sp.]|uniref:MlaD family protein n=1 Tax=Thalassobaculum sp. TaxID=2022740 RepID=UPI0032EC0099